MENTYENITCKNYISAKKLSHKFIYFKLIYMFVYQSLYSYFFYVFWNMNLSNCEKSYYIQCKQSVFPRSLRLKGIFKCTNDHIFEKNENTYENITCKNYISAKKLSHKFIYFFKILDVFSNLLIQLTTSIWINTWFSKIINSWKENQSTLHYLIFVYFSNVIDI
jgi:hypothetical protein